MVSFESKYRLISVLAILFAASYLGLGQSSDVSFPSPITSSQLVGAIKARELGDNRQTTYYYAFDGSQGDIFINVVTRNLDGEIEVFTVEGMRPLTRMVFYADSDSTETGRLIYLRKPERLLLRVQGRTPGDDAATFRVKFAGSFLALSGREDEMEKPVVESKETGSVRVNSVGTILGPVEKPPIAAKPKPTPADVDSSETTEQATAKNEKPKGSAPSKQPNGRRKKPEVVVTDGTKLEEETAAAKELKPKPPVKKPPVARKPPAIKPPEEPKSDPLANVKLVIVFKDGMKTEVGMPDLLRFAVDHGTLVVIRKNGTIERYQMVDIAKVTIE